MPTEHSTSVCCTLPEQAREARRDEVRRTIAGKIAEVRELDNGFALRFDAQPAIIEELGRFIAFEHTCCAFLDFSLRVAAGDGPTWLELTGPGETKTFLRPLLEERAR
jgi:hypothetical protein